MGRLALVCLNSLVAVMDSVLIFGGPAVSPCVRDAVSMARVDEWRADRGAAGERFECHPTARTSDVISGATGAPERNGMG